MDYERGGNWRRFARPLPAQRGKPGSLRSSHYFQYLFTRRVETRSCCWTRLTSTSVVPNRLTPTTKASMCLVPLAPASAEIDAWVPGPGTILQIEIPGQNIANHNLLCRVCIDDAFRQLKAVQLSVQRWHRPMPHDQPGRLRHVADLGEGRKRWLYVERCCSLRAVSNDGSGTNQAAGVSLSPWSFVCSGLGICNLCTPMLLTRRSQGSPCV